MTILLKRGTTMPTITKLSNYGEIAVNKSTGYLYVRTYSGIKVIRIYEPTSTGGGNS